MLGKNNIIRISRMKKVSLEDISKELGVSKTLISFVMNGRSEEKRVSKEMTEKVLAKAKEMGYKADYLARAMRTGKSNTIGLIMADISNIFFAKLARSIEDEANRFGYNVIFGSSDEVSVKTGKLIEVFRNKKVDGIIICPTTEDRKYILNLQRDDYPFVLLDRYFSNMKCNTVLVDNYQGTYDINLELLNNGSKRIAYINVNSESAHMKERLRGYLEVHKDSNVKVDHKLIKSVSFRNIGKDIETVIDDLFKKEERVDGIFFSNNHTAYVGIKHLLNKYKEELNHLSLGCFDSYDYTELLQFPFISGKQPIEEMGKKSVDLIMEQIEKGEFFEPKKVVLPIQFSHFGNKMSQE